MLNQFLLILQTLFSLVLPVTLICAAVSDLRHLEIANWVSIVIAIAFLPAAFLAEIPAADLAQHYGAGVALFVGGTVLFWLGMFGGGDVKLLAASGIWFEWGDLGLFLVAVALFGGLLALFILGVRKFGATFKTLERLPWLHESNGLNQPIPYGIAIAAAALTLCSRIPVLPPFIIHALSV